MKKITSKEAIALFNLMSLSIEGIGVMELKNCIHPEEAIPTTIMAYRKSLIKNAAIHYRLYEGKTSYMELAKRLIYNYPEVFVKMSADYLWQLIRDASLKLPDNKDFSKLANDYEERQAGE